MTAAGQAVSGAAELRWGGHTLVLLPDRAAWLPQRETLLVADVHIGKALSFRQRGVPVPHGTTSDTLDRLSALVRRLAARHVVVLGDFLHSAHAQAPATQGALRAWRQHHAGLVLTLVRGNHDQRAGDPAPELGMAVVDEPWRLAPMADQAGPALALCHHPQAVPGCQSLAGHWHPCVHLGGRARDRLRLPCFHFSDDQGVLPAFGSFTGMHPITRRAQDRVFAVAEAMVRAV